MAQDSFPILVYIQCVELLVNATESTSKLGAQIYGRSKLVRTRGRRGVLLHIPNLMVSKANAKWPPVIITCKSQTRMLEHKLEESVADADEESA